MEARLDVLLLEPGLFKNSRIRKEIDGSPAGLGLADHRKKAVYQLLIRNSLPVAVLIDLSALPHLHGHVLRKCVHDRRSDAVEAAGGCIRLIVEFAAGMERCEHNALRRHTLFMHINGDAASVVGHRAGPVRLQRHLDGVAKACEVLVDGVVHNFIDQVV